MSRSESPDDRLSEAEIEREFQNLSAADWKRAFNLARFCAAGLTGWSWESLLGEALAKLKSGERRWKRGVPPLVTLKMLMRSIASNNRKRDKNGPIDVYATVDIGVGDPEGADLPASVLPVDNRTPEEIADDRSQLKYIESLVVGDDEAEMVLMAWAEGLRGKDAAKELGFEMNQYEAARKRLVKMLEPAADLRKTA